MPPEGRIGTFADWLDKQAKKAAESVRKTLYSASISDGGLDITGTGGITVNDPRDSQNFFVGGRSDYAHADGTPQMMTVIRDEQGHARFAVWDASAPADPTNQQLYCWDARGNLVLATDDAGGLARPWLAMPTVNVLSNSIPTTGSASYMATQGTGWVVKQQPKADVQALLLSTGGAIGNARFTVNGTPAGSVMTIDANQFAWQALQTLTLPGNYNSSLRVELEVQVTNGVGSVGGVFVATQRQN